jgi:hypothetical protein
MPKTAARVIASCSFCLKPNTEVGKLVAGPGVYICNECVALCHDIVRSSTDSSADSPRPALWELEMSVGDVLKFLPQVAAAGAQVEDNLAHLVRKARSLGATWALIGESLHMTRQSAWERFSGEE